MTMRLACVCLLCLVAGAVRGEEEFTFDASEYEAQPYSFGGYLELRPTLSLLDRCAPAYELGHPDGGPSAEARYLLRAHLEGAYDGDDVYARLRTEADLIGGDSGGDATFTLQEAYAGWQVDPYLTLDVGKKQVKWGTGYSWSPVAFLDRPKDADDPDLPREGFSMLSVDYVKAFSGSIQNAALTLAAVPRTSDINPDFGHTDGTSYAGRLHLLWDNTDIDLMALTGDSGPVRYGMDFARNLQTNLEIHGEWSTSPSEPRLTVAPDGTLRTDQVSAGRLLLGLRYLTENEVTYILEYQHNGPGLSRSDMDDFNTYAEDALEQYRATGDTVALARARQLSRLLQSSQPLGRNYLYLRASMQEPGGILYLTPAVTLRMNLDDASFSLAPEVVYTGFTNWELRGRAYLLVGEPGSEFGGKPAQTRFELMARLYF